MKAMILAAGLGTRLRPLTDDRPKALVEVNGRPMLEITLSRLRSFGVREVIVNAYHFADMIVDYLRANQNFGMKIEVSREEELLDTGGGLKKAADFFLGNPRNSAQPFIVHNVDVLSTIDLALMLKDHNRGHALATLAVQDRKTSRYLLFGKDQQLCGRRVGSEAPEIVREAEDAKELAFCGIHVISPQLLPLITEEGAFSIIPTYLRLVSHGEVVRGFRADQYYWRDLGTPKNVEQAAQDMREDSNRDLFQ